MKELQTAKPSLWDVTLRYLSLKSEGKMKFLQKMPSGTPKRKTLIVTVHADTTSEETKEWVYDEKKKDYTLNGTILTTYLQQLSVTGSKIKIE